MGLVMLILMKVYLIYFDIYFNKYQKHLFHFALYEKSEKVWRRTFILTVINL